MSEKRVLLNHDMDVRKMSQPSTLPEGDPVILELWTLVFTDQTTGNTTEISFAKDTRNELVKRLTGGVVLAGGDLPNVGML